MDIADYLFSGDDEVEVDGEKTVKEEQNQGDMFSVMGKAAKVFANLNACSFRQPYRDIAEYCHSMDEETAEEVVKALKAANEIEIDDIAESSLCSFGSMMDNVTKNMFVLMGKFSSMAELMKVFPAESDDELHMQTLELGEDLGTFMKTAIGFTQ
mmetsp:Transcript_3664/g.2385  ORF Transcript_3664/g.2385 Transcript_3664/m.2385 type:complete len:155 (+) Transcript_3664:274-738(+)|eukprot:CAMPEP_0116877294 /NCGR_PEP_ID=MMETSP0463-20121206/9083_1 /TAXON_ID=181622 /ORGANISM="Strombidinopsis sp, Strain SopsisLIS2011" /LENGTH=154 /DNA_ID=CAMNT_0004524449 /DNA_START=243 /DNA_END=707 /DNA_ORIENTATION=+